MDTRPYSVGPGWFYNEWLSFGSRLRSGSNDNHVSPHITILDFDDNDTGDSHFNLDKYFVKANYQGAWTWVGRNSLSTMFWDDDATPVGIVAGYKIGVGNSEVAFNTGYFSLPAGMQRFSGNLALGQFVFSTKFNGSNKFTASAGLLAFDANIDFNFKF